MTHARVWQQLSTHPDPEGCPMFRHLDYTEPAVLRGIITAALALAGAVGFVVSEDIEGAAEGLIPVVALLVPLLQSIWTRAAVSSPKTVDSIRGKHTAP